MALMTRFSIAYIIWFASICSCAHVRFRRQDVVFPGDSDYVYGSSNIPEPDVPNTRTACLSPEQQPGVCVPFTECTHVMEWLQINRSTARRYMEAADCSNTSGFFWDPLKVCCSLVAPPLPTTETSPTSPKGQNIRQLLPASCGKQTWKIINSPEIREREASRFKPGSGNRVFVTGGQDVTTAAKWPWMAILGYLSEDGTIKFLCGGALITDQHVLTAAHCVSNRNDLILVRLGELDLNSDQDGASPVSFQIAAKFSHEDYALKPSVRNDIAVIKLASKVNFNSDVQPICLPVENNIRQQNFAGKTGTITGWGTLSFGGSSSNILQEVELPIVTEEKCKNAFAIFRNVIIDRKIMCAGVDEGGKDACQGDSGGPLTILEGNTYYLAGVVSFGFRCGTPGIPGVYTRVTEYVDWILDKLA